MPIPTMRAVCIYRYGGPEQLILDDVPLLKPGEGEVLVRVAAAGVNPLDWKIRQGLMEASMPVTFPYTPGIELAGIVAEVGPGVTGFERGQAVFGQCAGGAYAEYALVSAQALALKPASLSMVEAAAVPVGATTAWRALFEFGGLESGQRVLIQGAAGGVGLFAVQLAKWKGAYVIGTASTANLDFVRGLGADEVVDYTTIPIERAAREVDMAVDGVGGESVRSSLATLRQGGTLISLAGPPPQEQAQVRGVRAMMMRSQSSREILQRVARLIEEGQIGVTAGRSFPLSAAPQAHEYGQRGHGRGRIVLVME